MYNDKYFRTKINIYNDRIITNFQIINLPKDDECCACLFVILLDSLVVNADKKCYPQVFLEQCTYVEEKKKITKTSNKEFNLDESDDKSDRSDEDQNCTNKDINIYEQ